MFTSDISLGTVIAAVAVLLALYKFHMSNVDRITNIEHRVSLMWGVFKQRFNISDAEEENAQREMRRS